MKKKLSNQENNFALAELTKEETIKISGGDGITKAVFYAIGYWVQAYSDFKADTETSYSGSAGFM